MNARAAVVQHCGSSPAIPTPLGGVTEALRSDTATAVVQLHPKRLFDEEQVMQQVLSSKRRHARIRGRGAMAAHRAFTSPVRVQVPPAPLVIWACSSMVRAGSL